MDRGAKHVLLLCVIGSLLGLCTRGVFPDAHNPIGLVALEAIVITAVVQAFARVTPVRELVGSATGRVRGMLSFLLLFTVFGHVGKVSQLTFPFSAWNMYDVGPGTRDLYRFIGVKGDGTAAPLCPAELYPSLGSFRLASTMAQCAIIATASDAERTAMLGEFPRERADSVRELDALCAALARAHERTHGTPLSRITVEKCLMPFEDPAALACESVHEWRP